MASEAMRKECTQLTTGDMLIEAQTERSHLDRNVEKETGLSVAPWHLSPFQGILKAVDGSDRGIRLYEVEAGGRMSIGNKVETAMIRAITCIPPA